MMEACCSRFTAAEGGARLAAAASTKNILAVEYASFIPVRLLYEKAYQIRGLLSTGRRRSVYVTRATRVPVVTYELKILTDLAVISACDDNDTDWATELESNEVLVCTSPVLHKILEDGVLTMNNINVLVVDSCHLIYKDDHLKYIMRLYKECSIPDRPIILALTYPLFTSPKKEKKELPQQESQEIISIKRQQEIMMCKGSEEELGVYENLDDFDLYEKLEWKIEELENELCCQMDLAEDIDGGKRISSSQTKPREMIIEYGCRPSEDEMSDEYKHLEKFMIDAVDDAVKFIDDHRHDPTEIYGEELYEEFENMPDPRIDPMRILRQFLYVLEQLGPYAADKAALCLLTNLEKLKIKVPFERHFLLLCLCTTVFIKIRGYADYIFSQYENDWEKIKLFSAPKVLRFGEILERFQPPDLKKKESDSAVSDSQSQDSQKSDSVKKMLNDIDMCDFTTLGNKLQDRVNIYESNLKDLDDIVTEISNIDEKNKEKMDVDAESKQQITKNEDNSENKDQITEKVENSDTNTTKSSNNDTQNSQELSENATKSDTKQPNIENVCQNDSQPDSQHDSQRDSQPDSQRDSQPDSQRNSANPDSKILDILNKSLLPFTRRVGHRARGRSRLQRNNAARMLQMQQNPDALCGIVYMKDALIAKIMFMVLVDMSRCNRKLSYLCAQYCATESPADPGTELKECQRQGKKQEEVLKKFRMHECNLLLATSALEEGIDLPRCNLVLRWDVPPSYRSYGLCRGRARAARATSALLCSYSTQSTDEILHNVATYRELDQLISRKCGCGIQDEPPQSEEDHADQLTIYIKPYTPVDSTPTDSGNKTADSTTVVDSGNKCEKLDSQGLSDSVTIEKSDDVKDSYDDSVAVFDSIKRMDEKDNVDNNSLAIADTTITMASDENKIDEVNSQVVSVSDSTTIKNVNSDDLKSVDSDAMASINEGENIKVDTAKEEIKQSDSMINTATIDSNINIDIVKDTNKIDEIDTNITTITTNNNKPEDAKVKNTENEAKIKIKDKKKICNVLEASIKEKVEKEQLDSNKSFDSHDSHDSQTIEISDIVKDSDEQSTEKEHIDSNKSIDSHDSQTIAISDIAKDSDDKVIKSDIIDDLINKTAELKINNEEKDTETCISDEKADKINENSAKIDTNTLSSDIQKEIQDNNTKNIQENANLKEDIPISDSQVCDSIANVKCSVSFAKHDSKVDSRNIGDCDTASVDLSSAIALINRYCGKLPSDTFTRLAPQWWMEQVQLPVGDGAETKTAYICTLRLPLNCPVKYNIVGHPMPTKVLARRMVALQACRILHKSGELDNQLMPIGKENFKAVELEASNTIACNNNDVTDNSDSARPGTTKRRQYYYKRTAWAFTDCQPVVDTSDSEIDPPDNKETQNKPPKEKKTTGKKRNMLYAIVSCLWCALPERYNTRGRRLHAPQNATQAIGVLMARDEPCNLQIPAFPVYTRSGEVRVSVEHVPDADVRLSPRRGRLVRRFMRFVFAEVLRVRRRGMKLQSDGSTHNNYYIVPTVKTTRPDGTAKIDIDWAFLELIYQHTEDKKILEIDSSVLWETQEEEEGKSKLPARERRNRVKKMDNPLLKPGETFEFDAEKYREAVVTPWYRNQDQPQFFLVAEICWNLTPDSSFPSSRNTSFREYYSSKYGVALTQSQQPLLDVDHTSARLNLLTPRYVNRKGVALPVSSERTRRAKRDRLDQKQILVPELCRVHPFAAPLWFATVALPCVLYRINALLIADEIRRAVAIDVGLGIPKINDTTMPGFQWPALDFGWSLAEVLSADSEKNEKKKEEEELKKEQKEKEIKEKEEKEREENDKKKEAEGKEEAEEPKEKTINDILQEKEDAEGFEIGTWSNDMASALPEDTEFDEFLEPLPPNLTFCTSASGGTNWCDPITKPKYNQYNPSRMYSMVDSDCSYMSSDLDSDDTDLDYEGSEDDTENGFCCHRNTNMAMGVRIEYKTAHEAEAVDVEGRKKVNPAPAPNETDDVIDRDTHVQLMSDGVAPEQYIQKFRASVDSHKKEIIANGHLIPQTDPLNHILPENKDSKPHSDSTLNTERALKELFPYSTQEIKIKNGQIDIASIEKNKRVLLNKLKSELPDEKIKELSCFSMKDINIDSENYVNEKIVNVGFDKSECYEDICKNAKEFGPYYAEKKGGEFDFDFQPKLEGHPGPSPSVILQALTMSNANDGINLERLETIGDSFLKFAITAYLYCAHPTVHEGKLSHMRSKQVSNLNLYRLGRNKRLGARMIASKFEPHDNWLPPCHKPPPTLHPSAHGDPQLDALNPDMPLDATGCFIPYNLITQHSIPDKSIADCVEALIGAYLLECGPRGALLFMSWLGIKVLPCHRVPLDSDHPYVKHVAAHKTDSVPPPAPESPKRQRTSSSSSECSSEDEDPQPQQEVFPDDDWSWPGRAVGSLQPYQDENGVWMQPIFGELKAPPSPLLRYIEDPEGELEQMLSGYDGLERTLQYRFKDRSLLLQALTHASHHSNRLTDCYQRLEFLGDAILDYLITRHLYEDPRRHSPGALTDLRSALVNNTIFATLAARHGFHKYFRHMSPGLNEVLTKYVKIQEENGHSISEEHYLIQEDEMEQAEDVEVPKALGDLFESVAGAIFLDSGMSLGAVWKSYVNLMGAELEAFSAAAPKSPVRELLEAEPDTAKFGKPERLADGRRVRVCVEVFGRGTFKGVGRNYRIAKGTAARCALRHLRGHRGH
ncbi:endoribonuclease Dcr-1 [Anticarsia gemmatalis]|uniref:endoribonuclease Dcr-1 n=1 Tax=Anticarsia gemmatalis TaxID=129554 RepID=UPI003F759310